MKEELLSSMKRAFNPRNVAVVGATDSPDRVGYSIMESILDSGFKRNVYPVHPRLEVLHGLKVYSSLEEIPEQVDAVVVAVNQHATVKTIEESARLGIKAAICVSGGFREVDEEGRCLEEHMIKVARENNMALVGPNTLGLINNRAGFNSTFYPLDLKPGNVSFITQSGGIGLTIINRACDEGLGINKWVGVGNRSVLEITDYLEYFAEDDNTGVIGIFLEGTEDARNLVYKASQVGRKKPVVIYKAGRSRPAGYAASTHTGSAGGSYQVYRDIFHDQFGVFMADSTEEMVTACKALSVSDLPGGGRLGIITHTAGPSIALLDELARKGITVPQLEKETIEKIKAVLGENPAVILKNPLDIAGGGLNAGTYGKIVNAVLEDPNIDLCVGIYCLHKNWRFPSMELIEAQQRNNKPVLAYYVSTLEGCSEDRYFLQGAGVPLYVSAKDLVGAVSALVHYSRVQGRGKYAG